MARKPRILGTFILSGFDKVGQVVSISRRDKYIEVDVGNYTTEDAHAIWDIIGERNTRVEVTDLEDGTLFKCSVYGTEAMVYADGKVEISLQLLSKEEMLPIEDRPPTSA